MGLGLSMYVEVCGLGPSSSLPTGGWEHAQVTVERDGRISATTGASPHGQGNETTFAQMLADQFGVPIEHVTILHGDTGVVKQGIGTFGSRSQAVGGTALHMAGAQGEGEDGEVRGGACWRRTRTTSSSRTARFGQGRAGRGEAVRGGRRLRVRAGAAAAGTRARASATRRSSSRPTTRTRSAATSRCSKSIATPASRRCSSSSPSTTAGNLINPLIVEGQIHGGLAQGIGQAMIEEVVYNEDGQLLTGSFMDYAHAARDDFPRFELDATVTPTPVNPLGAKGVGEAGTLGSTPCIVNAAVDALSEFGVKHIDMMLRPEKLWRIIQRRPGVIPTAFEYARATSLDDALAKLRAADGAGKLHGGRPQPHPADEAAAERARALIDIARIPGWRHSREGRQDRDRRGHRPPRRRGVRRCSRQAARSWPRPPATIGDPQVRNRGTLGGSLAHADPAADYPAAMLALDADDRHQGAEWLARR